MADSTSPDDLTSVSPPLMTTFVVPTAIARSVAEHLTSLGMVVGVNPATPDENTYLAIPRPELAAALTDVTGRYHVDFPTNPHESVRITDRSATVDLVSAWHPALHLMVDDASSLPWPVIPEVDTLPPALGLDPERDGESPRCSTCGHTQQRHIAGPYVRGDEQRAVVMCQAQSSRTETCPCLTRLG